MNHHLAGGHKKNPDESSDSFSVFPTFLRTVITRGFPPRDKIQISTMTEHIKSSTARRISNVLAHMGKVSQERHECKNGGASSNSNKTSSCGTCVRQHDCAATTSSVPCDIEELPSKSYQRKSSADMADHNPSYLFDPDRFNEVQKPLLQASTLPSECYTSTTWFNRELERVFVPSWTLLGREDEISSICCRKLRRFLLWAHSSCK